MLPKKGVLQVVGLQAVVVKMQTPRFSLPWPRVVGFCLSALIGDDGHMGGGGLRV